MGRVHGLLLNETHVCMANRMKEGICGETDIGAPLVTRHGELVGIASWYDECGTGKPDVFTRVFVYLDWMQTVMMNFEC